MRVVRALLVLLLTAAPAHAALDFEYEAREMSFELDNGREVRVDLRVPVGAEPPFAAVMVFAGFEAAGYVLDLLPPTAPVVKASFDYPFDPPRRAGGLRQALGWLPQARDAIHMTLEGIGHLHEMLAAMPEVDPEHITVAGVSLGAPFATIAAQRHDIPGVAIIHGFGEIPVVIRHVMHRRLEERMGWWAGPVSSIVTRYAVWYARVPVPEDYARRYPAERRVLVIDAEEDHLVPASASEALHEALAASEASIQVTVTPGGHVDEGAYDLIDEILARLADWLDRDAALARHGD